MKKVLFAVVALSAMFISCNKCENQEEKDAAAKAEIQANADAKAQPSEGIDAISLAMDMAAYGHKTEDASVLIKAADILVSTPTQAMPEDRIGEQGEPQGEVAEKEGKHCFCPKHMLAEAKELAGDDAQLLAQIEAVEKKMAAQAEGTRGAEGGPIEYVGRVNAYSYNLYTIPFRGYELGEVAIIGDGDTDLDLYVYDGDGDLGVYDNSYGSNCYVNFTPLGDQTVTVKVVNRGNVYSDFILLTN